jgi:hypothetical protein
MADSVHPAPACSEVRRPGCALCGSANQRKFTGELAIHFSGLKGINKPIVWVCPELSICQHCGRANFDVPEAELRILTEVNELTDSRACSSAPLSLGAQIEIVERRLPETTQRLVTLRKR